MGSAASKSARSAAGAASRRQYPKQPSPPPRGSPSSATAPEGKAAPTPTSSPSPSPSAHPTSQGPTYHSKEPPSNEKSNAIDLDGRDPNFAASLRSIGPVNPAPTQSHSSTFNRPTPGHPVSPQASNPALLVIAARQRITKAAEEEAEQVGRESYAGRQFVDALTIQHALSMRDQQGLSPEEIERTLHLKTGVMDRLGKDGLVSRIA